MMVRVVPERQSDAFEKELGARQLFMRHDATWGLFLPQRDDTVAPISLA